MPNRLAQESSPYLLQHAHNPVEWWPWCDAAFEEARRRDVPVFLSIGYSTCYWCHVMERESFENESIAEALNPRFVCIKVDREERPDVDEIYMAATVMMTGHGGWPMTVFLEPQRRRPFFCGTYFPPQPRPDIGRPGLPQLLDAMSEAWRTQRAGVIEQAQAVADSVAEHFAAAAPARDLSAATVTEATGALLKVFDRVHGGFGRAPKFPQPEYLEFLLDVRERAADDATGDAIDQAVRRTLLAMSIGGLFDQVGGGFHRYSVDETWTVPHFEKMLYDNALLAGLYARAARFYGDADFENTARRTLDYVLREMTDPATGAFFSAQDAEVNHREGQNYLWTPAQIRQALGPDNADDAELALAVYGLTRGTNFRDPHHPSEPPSNVLRLADRADRVAASLNMLPGTLADRLARINTALYVARAARPQPSRDDKVIASWNGLMIAALARAAADIGEPLYLNAATRACDFLLANMLSDGRLARTWRGGTAKGRAVLEDYACVIRGLLETHRTARDQGRDASAYLAAATQLLATVRADFTDDQSRLFDSSHDATDLFVRTRATHDGAIPCGYSVMLHNLLDLAEVTENPDYLTEAVGTLAAASGAIAENPTGSINSVLALLRILLEGREISAAGSATAPAPPRLAQEVDPVQVLAAEERIAISPGRPAELTLVVRIAPGWHIAAADPTPAAPDNPTPPVRPFRIGLTGGTGVAVYADYPAGDPFAAPGGSAIRVYHEEIEIRIVVEQTGDIHGRPLLTVAYQACNNTECLAPATVELDIAIDEGA